MAECAQFSIAKCRPAARCFTLVLLFIAVGTPTNRRRDRCSWRQRDRGGGPGPACNPGCHANRRIRHSSKLCCVRKTARSASRTRAHRATRHRLCWLAFRACSPVIQRCSSLTSAANNDSHNHMNDTKQNMAAIKALAAQHGVKVISYGDARRQALKSIGGGAHCADADCHMDAEANAAIARYLLPLVKNGRRLSTISPQAPAIGRDNLHAPSPATPLQSRCGRSWRNPVPSQVQLEAQQSVVWACLKLVSTMASPGDQHFSRSPLPRA